MPVGTVSATADLGPSPVRVIRWNESSWPGTARASARSTASPTAILPSRVALTATGREEARRLGSELAGDPIDLCVTSEFERARETADLALEGRDVPRLVLAELNDIRFGEFEGRPLTDYRAWAHAHGPRGRRAPAATAVPRRSPATCAAYRTILARPEATVLVVAHGLPVRYVLDAVEGRDPAAAVAQVPYAEPFRLSARRARDGGSTASRPGSRARPGLLELEVGVRRRAVAEVDVQAAAGARPTSCRSPS